MPALSTLRDWERRELVQAIDRSWQSYFHIGEARDFAFDLACLLFELGEIERARARLPLLDRALRRRSK